MGSWKVENGYEIKLTAYFDEMPTTVMIKYDLFGGDVWRVYLDNYFHGRVWHTDNFGWRNDIHATSPLSIDDIDTIIELITKHAGLPIPG